METLNKDNKEEFDSAIIDAIDEEYGEGVWDEDYVEFIVGTDEQADEMFDNYLEDYLDEVILSQLPESMHFYFDSDKWKNDAEFDTDRASCLASHDNKELKTEIDGIDYYIYRTN